MRQREANLSRERTGDELPGAGLVIAG